MFCTKCGKEVSNDAVFCGNCGNKLDNIYASANGLVPATWKKRLMNDILDGIIGTIFLIAAFIILIIIFRAMGSDYISRIVDELGASYYTLWTVLVLAYYVIFEYVWAKTPAKFLTGTVVVTETGGRPNFSAVVKRTLVRLIPIEFLSFLSDRPVGWHDKWAKTLVIDDRK